MLLPGASHGHSAGGFSTVTPGLWLLTPMGVREPVRQGCPKQYFPPTHPQEGAAHPWQGPECLYDIPKWMTPQSFRGMTLIIPQEQDRYLERDAEMWPSFAGNGDLGRG